MEDLSKYPGLSTRNGVYYARLKVPEEARSIIGKTELKETLKTGSLKEALPKYREKIAEFNAQIEAAKLKASAPVILTPLTEDTARQLARLFFHEREAAWQPFPPEMDDADKADILRDLNMDQADLLDPNNTNCLSSTQSMARRLLQEHSLKPDDSYSAFNQLCELIRRAWLEHIERSRARYQGRDGTVGSDRFFREITADRNPPSVVLQTASEPIGPATFDELVEGWKISRKPTPRTIRDVERSFRKLGKFVGHSDARQLATADISRWMISLAEKKRTPKSIFNTVSYLSAVLNWGKKHGRIPANPVSGLLEKPKSNPGERRIPYLEDEAAAILNASRTKSGALRFMPWLYALTGARREELCKLKVGDVRNEDGIWIIDIKWNTEEERLKNPGSERMVPVHPLLEKEGFLKFVKDRDPEERVFTELKQDRDGKFGESFYKLYAPWYREQLGITDKRQVGHSWRHWFKDQLRAQAVDKAINDALTGHHTKDEGDRYGLGYPISVLYDAVCKIPLPQGVSPIKRG